MLRDGPSVLGAAGLLAILTVAAPAFAQVDLQILPSATTVAQGATVDVPVIVSGLGDHASPGVRTFDLVMEFDPTHFAYTGLTVGSSLGNALAAPPESIVSTTTGASELDVLQVSLLAPADLVALQPESLTLFTAHFRALEFGDGAFGLTLNADLGDEFADPIALGRNQGASVHVANVVELPTASESGLFVLATALLALGLWFLPRKAS